ncbi:MAG: GIY-YIG nuclease family protein [Pseudohongiella sp.]|nr:GIY-YIG nuclease family protein [Pseudohongiella sp.]
MYTYFIVENEDSAEWRIKIGFSKNPGKRIRELQTGSSRKLAILGWIESGDSFLEKALHLKYQQHRLNGEWFSIEPEDVLEELRRKGASSFICIQSNAGTFLGCDKDAIPEYLGPWGWLDTEMEEFCPQCGWGGGVHFNEAIGSENCLRCGYPIFSVT